MVYEITNHTADYYSSGESRNKDFFFIFSLKTIKQNHLKVFQIGKQESMLAKPTHLGMVMSSIVPLVNLAMSQSLLMPFMVPFSEYCQMVVLGTPESVAV